MYVNSFGNSWFWLTMTRILVYFLHKLYQTLLMFICWVVFTQFVVRDLNRIEFFIFIFTNAWCHKEKHLEHLCIWKIKRFCRKDRKVIRTFVEQPMNANTQEIFLFRHSCFWCLSNCCGKINRWSQPSHGKSWWVVSICGWDVNIDEVIYYVHNAILTSKFFKVSDLNWSHRGQLINSFSSSLLKALSSFI